VAAGAFYFFERKRIMESWQADYDRMLLRQAEQAGDIYDQDVECECGSFVDPEDIHICADCGEGQGCRHCMYYDPDRMEWFCNMECVREMERKDRKEKPDFDGIFSRFG